MFSRCCEHDKGVFKFGKPIYSSLDRMKKGHTYIELRYTYQLVAMKITQCPVCCKVLLFKRSMYLPNNITHYLSGVVGKEADIEEVFETLKLLLNKYQELIVVIKDKDV